MMQSRPGLCRGYSELQETCSVYSFKQPFDADVMVLDLRTVISTLRCLSSASTMAATLASRKNASLVLGFYR
jgi:hypothetical protein